MLTQAWIFCASAPALAMHAWTSCCRFWMPRWRSLGGCVEGTVIVGDPVEVEVEVVLLGGVFETPLPFSYA